MSACRRHYGNDDVLTNLNLCYVCVCVLRVLASFIVGLFNLYEDLYFTYLEINPLGTCS